MASLSSQSSPRAQPSRRQRQDKDQRVVNTPYGRGLVVRTRSNDAVKEIELLDWAAARTTNKPPMLHSTQTFASVKPIVGDDIICLYGRGRVIRVDEDHQKCQVELSNWRLAQRCTVQCFLAVNQVSVVRKKTLYEMNAFEKVVFAQAQKQTATTHFTNKEYKLALEHYDKAVTSVRYVQHDAHSTNELRADLLVVMITCCNNAGTCCSLLKENEEAIKFANNALVLLDALYEKRGLKIHSILNNDGLSDVKLFGEWRTKSLLIKANGLMGRGDYEQALEILKEAHHVIETHMETEHLQDAAFQKSYATLHKQAKEVNRLRATCVQQKRQLKKKEKQRAQAMFATTSSTSSSSKNNNKTVKISETAKKKETTTVAKEPAAAVLEMSEREKAVEEVPTIKTKRSVSFSEDTKPGKDFAVEEEEEVPWYDEHKEALILSGIVGLAALTTVFLRGRK